MALRSINPTTGATTAEFQSLSAAELESALDQSERAFVRQRNADFDSRAQRLLAVAALLSEESDRWALLLTQEMGKPLAAAVAEVEKCAWVCRYYAEHGETFLRDREIETDADRSFVTHLPLGSILAVMPWKFPFWQVFRFAAPAIMAGNVVVLKHASNVPSAALALQEIFERAEFEPGVFQALLIDTESVERVIGDRRIRAATVTGSIRAGSAVASIAGKHCKKTVLELGGSDAFIVMPSAALERAIDVGVESRTLNNGQSCIAAKRFIVHESAYDRFVDGFVERFEALTVGDPVEESTDIGPLAMMRTRDRLARQVRSLLEHGATRLTGARALEGPGFFFEPGVLADIPSGAAAYREELFGPVAMLFKVRSLDQAIDLANDNPYGLASSIWTEDGDEADRAVRGIAAGATFVNALVKSDPRLPFGGVGSSGYGRELSRAGILEFVNRKTVLIERTGEA